MRKRALILGGGGASGNAWTIGIIAGLFKGGLNLSEADLIVGTSAGATAAAQITAATAPQLLADVLSAAPPQRSGPAGRLPKTRAGNPMERTSRILADAKDAADMRRSIGAALLEMDGPSDVQWRATVGARLPNPHWPERPMLITAVDAHNGEPVVFDRDSGVELVDAVAASTAGGFAYGIGDKRYIDGGYRADVNADLAAGYARVLVIPPLGEATRKPLSWGLHVAAQVDQLRATGSRVETIDPDSQSRNAIGAGMELMDPSRRRPSAQAGYDQGGSLADQLMEFWR